MKPENQDQAVHRAGPAKQDNKKHKTGRHRSKGTIEILKKGTLLKYYRNLIYKFINL
jgi:hypothetical protein